MDTDKEEPLYKAESQRIVGSAMEVLNGIGHSEFQASKTGMETSHPMNLSVSISVHQWLKTKSQIE
jgi:hypothetical protein